VASGKLAGWPDTEEESSVTARDSWIPLVVTVGDSSMTHGSMVTAPFDHIMHSPTCGAGSEVGAGAAAGARAWARRRRWPFGMGFLGASHDSPSSISRVDMMAPMGLALVDPMTHCDQTDFQYGDKHIPSAALYQQP